MKYTPLALLLVSSLAAAKPLPPTIKVKLVKSRVMVTINGQTTPLEASKLEVNKLVSAEISDDGKTLLIKRERCMSTDIDEDAAEFPIAELEAKIENGLGMALHLKKKYADAIPHFTLAAQKDPAQPVYATNLLSAQAMAGKLDDADKTIATYAKAQLPWFAWRLAVDSDLKALKGRPSTKLGPAKAGTAKGPLGLAYSPLGLVASEVENNMYDGVPDGSGDEVLIIVDIASSKELLRLHTQTNCGVDMESGKPDKACEKKVASKNAAERKVADALLAQLGFEMVPGGLKNLSEENVKISAPDGRKLTTGDKLEVIAGKTRIDLGDKLSATPWSAAFVPKAVVVMTRDKVMEDCSGEGPRNLHLEMIATP
jgi:hypothetical protein